MKRILIFTAFLCAALSSLSFAQFGNSPIGSQSLWVPGDNGTITPFRVPSIPSITGYPGLLAPGKAVSYNGTDERATIAAASLGPDNFESGTETILNTTFDTDLTSWTTVSGTVTADAAAPHTGAKCLKVVYSGAANGWASQVATVTAGDRMALVFWAKGDGANPGRYRVLNNDTSEVIVPFTWCTATATWTCYRVIIDVPAACTGIKVDFVSSGVDAAAAYFDDVSFRKQYDLSWVMWVKRTADPNTTRQYVWARLGTIRMWHLRFVGTGESDDTNIGAVKFGWTYQGDTTTAASNPSTTKLAQNTWYLVGATFEPGATASSFVQKIYVNGRLEGTVTSEGPIYPGAADMSFGATTLAGSEHWFAGEIGESQIVRGRAFTADEMFDIFKNGIRESYSTGTVICHYDWRGGSDANMLLDISSQTNDLTGANVTQAGDQTTGSDPYYTRILEISRSGVVLSREAVSALR